MQEDLAALAHQNVDLVDLRQASTVMRVEVLRDAILLIDAQPSPRSAFEAFALSAYARLNEERRENPERLARQGTSPWMTSP